MTNICKIKFQWLLVLLQIFEYIQFRSEQLKIVKSCHIDATLAHRGLKKTIGRIRERFIWKGIWNDAKEAVSLFKFGAVLYH